MTEYTQNFLLRAGRDALVDISILTSTGGAVDVTGATYDWAMFRERGSTAVLRFNGTTEIEEINSTAGLVRLHFDKTITSGKRGVYHHRLNTVLANFDDTQLEGFVTVLNSEIPST